VRACVCITKKHANRQAFERRSISGKRSREADAQLDKPESLRHTQADGQMASQTDATD
jgi:hypothetical protein